MAFSDEQIERDIIDQLRGDQRVAGTDIRVTVERGEVTLSGMVPTYSARETARSDTWRVPGVRAVRNELAVRPSAPLPADELVERNVRSIIGWNADIGGSRVSASVRRGHVTLTGRVDAAWKRDRAAELVSYVGGVTGITNEIAVIPTGRAEDIGRSREGDPGSGG
jgi:osmotically-inducible protein OsmY